VTGTTFQFVPCRGAAPLNQDLVAGHIDLMLGMAAAKYPLVRSGQIKAYAMTSLSHAAGAHRCSPTDTFGRLMAQRLSEQFGKQFHVENIPDAGGNIEISRAAKAAADGSTIIVRATIL
jgi:tripartite-type tricarboxylate transporter receptor subunit TctC